MCRFCIFCRLLLFTLKSKILCLCKCRCLVQILIVAIDCMGFRYVLKFEDAQVRQERLRFSIFATSTHVRELDRLRLRGILDWYPYDLYSPDAQPWQMILIYVVLIPAVFYVATILFLSNEFYNVSQSLCHTIRFCLLHLLKQNVRSEKHLPMGNENFMVS